MTKPSTSTEKPVSNEFTLAAGLVLTEEMLPEDKQYLAGALVLEKYDDGRFLAVSAELLGEGGTHIDFTKAVQDLNAQYGCELFTPTHDQLSILLDNEELTDLAKIDGDKAYMVDDPGNPISGTVPVRWSFENSRDMYANWKDSCSKFGRCLPNNTNDLAGRAMSYEEKFDLVDVAPE